MKKILIANRGEIALRVMRTAKSLGYRTVAVYSAADARAPHVSAADEAVPIGPAPVKESYLAIDRIIAAARASGADAIHPGYGLLSENASFARACESAGLVFIGPPAAAIELMGNKRRAKREMERAGVPCVPGYSGEDQADERMRVEAERIGYPVMVKAAAGGGGRGMRLVAAASELIDALGAARAEAKSAFGDDELLLEKAIREPRHVEVQIFGDRLGNVIHLGERDCSIQRRHQKVVEESPSPAVDPDLRARMGAAAVAAAKACGYTGAGTVEFLLDAERRFYFLEMNTRLQVEHPVTEAVTGLDLVAWQLRIADGRALPLTQDRVRFEGAAIEVRIYAEDPAQDFRPQTGQLVRWRLPTNVRVDAGVVEGGEVSPHYDAMLAKMIAHGASREEARRKLIAALADTTIFGLTTNKSFLAEVAAHPVFAAGGATTAFLAEHFPSGVSEAPSFAGFATAALALYLEGARGLAEDESWIGWRSGSPIWSTLRLAARGTEREILVTAARGELWRRYTFRSNEEQLELEALESEGELILIGGGGVRTRIRYALAAGEVWTDDGRRVERYLDITHRPAETKQVAGTGRIAAPHDGAITRLFVEPGQTVVRGQLLLALEAMKMEQRIAADVDGSVAAIHVKVGDQVKLRQLLVEVAQCGS